MNTVVRNPRDAAIIRLDDLVWKGIVKAATDAALPANTRTGNVLIADANGAFPTVDGVTINTDGTAGLNDGTESGSDKILVKNEATGANNGKYFLSDPGSAGQKWRATRTSDANSSSEVTAGFYVWVDQGTAELNTTWAITTDDPITLNTTSITFGKMSGLGQINAGTGMTKTGDTLNVIGLDGIVANADDIAVDFNTTNLKITAGQINTIQNIDTTASPTFEGLTAIGTGTRTITVKTTQSTGFAIIRLRHFTDSTDELAVQNLGTAVGGTTFGVSNGNLSILNKVGNGNLVIGTIGTGFLVLGTNNVEVVKIDTTLMAVTGQITATEGVDISASQSFSVAGTAILSDAAGTMTLSNVDALDATTESTIEAAIDTLDNLTSAVALVTVGTLTTGDADAIVSAASLTVAGKVELATGTETNTGTDATRAVTPDGLDDWTGSTQITTLGTLTSDLIIGAARVQQSQGSDVASTNDLVLGGDGNDFVITGTTDVNLISNLTWQNGSTIRLFFTSTATIKDDQATSGNNITILLDGSLDFNPTAGDNIQLTLNVLSGVQAWRESGGRNVL